MANGNVDLAPRHRPKLDRGQAIAAGTAVFVQDPRKETDTVHEEATARARNRAFVQLGRQLAFAIGHTREKVQAALGQCVVPERGIIRQSLNAHIAAPQSSVALGPVLKHRLHAVGQGPQADTVYGLPLRRQLAAARLDLPRKFIAYWIFICNPRASGLQSSPIRTGPVEPAAARPPCPFPCSWPSNI